MCAHYKATTGRDRYRRHFGVEAPAGAERIDLWPGYAGSNKTAPKRSEKTEISLVRFLAAEYLTFVAATLTPRTTS